MHINVNDILAQDLGYSREYRISGEEPELDQITLVKPIDGELKLTRLERSIAAEGFVQTAIELECHRCLRTFERPVAVRLKAIYAEDPQDDELLIDRQGHIDAGEMIQQEILVTLPIKLLCREDCTGIFVGDASKPSDEA